MEAQQAVEVRPADLVCLCMLQDPHERLSAWSVRWRRVAARLAAKRRRFDPVALMATIRLVRELETGAEEAFSLANWHKSHHLPACAFSGRRNPAGTVSRLPEAQWVSPRSPTAS